MAGHSSARPQRCYVELDCIERAHSSGLVAHCALHDAIRAPVEFEHLEEALQRLDEPNMPAQSSLEAPKKAVGLRHPETWPIPLPHPADGRHDYAQQRRAE